VAAAVVIVWFLARIQVVVIATVVGLMVAGVLTPAVEWLAARGVSRRLAPLVAFGAVVVVFGLLMLYALVWLASDWDEIRSGVQNAITLLGQRAQSGGVGLADNAATEVNSAVGQGWASVGGSLGKTVLQRVAFLGSLLLGIFVGLGLASRLLRGGDRLWGGIVRRVAPSRRDIYDAVGRQGLLALGAYIWGQTIVAMVDAGLVALALILMGMGGNLGLVPLVFFAAFIPYIGMYVWGSLFVLLAISEGDLQFGLVALFVVIAIRIAERQVLGRVLSKRIRLEPFEVLYLIILFYYFGGVIAVFLALPMTAALRAMYDEYRRIRLVLPEEAKA